MAIHRWIERQGADVLIALNLQEFNRFGYRIGFPGAGFWREIFNSDSQQYGGADYGNLGGAEAQDAEWHGKPYSLNLIVPPLGAVFFKSE